MYWDVVEVKPEPGYSLFVRFKDGLAGRVQLRREDLTGALAPLLDAQFFEQVFIDYGAVAWPGEIDLAPDAMYDQVANRLAPQPAGEVVDRDTLKSQLPRLYELKDLIPGPFKSKCLFPEVRKPSSVSELDRDVHPLGAKAAAARSEGMGAS
jgi:hypothetical protein